MRKPAGMKVRTYYQALLRINLEELTVLPPFGANQRLSDDELLDIILFGTPKAWQREMDRQGCDPVGQPLNEVIDFLENIEAAEDFDGTKVETKKKATPTKSKDKGSDGYYCLLHGKNKTHGAEDCAKMKAEANASRAALTPLVRKDKKTSLTRLGVRRLMKPRLRPSPIWLPLSSVKSR